MTDNHPITPPPEPQWEGPSDEELYDLADEYNGEPVASMQAALARWGRAALAQPAPPAEGEVGELVDWLRNHASAKGRTQRESFLRAADLLERQQPVPVSERLPLPGEEVEL